MVWVRLVLSIVLVSCTPERHSAPAEARPAKDATSPAPVDAPEPSPTARLPEVDFGPAGPLAVKGYPIDLPLGSADYADRVGFTSSREFGYCGEFGGTEGESCRLVDAAGNQRALNDFNGTRIDPRVTAQIRAVERSGLVRLRQKPGKLVPPSVTGIWRFAHDIQMRVSATAGVFDNPTGAAISQPLIRIGGALLGEDPVWVIVLSPPHQTMEGGEIPFTIELNALALSPDGQELGAVTHAFCGEFCNEMQIVRRAAGAFAGRIYNDTGFRHHKRGEFVESASLFLRATSADPGVALYPYNLACAWARLSDPRARIALATAVARGGPDFKKRAMGDHDFAAVQKEAWFVTITR
jgi:hypothetical protein